MLGIAFNCDVFRGSWIGLFVNEIEVTGFEVFPKRVRMSTVLLENDTVVSDSTVQKEHKLSILYPSFL